MNCIKCGKNIADGELFCRECSLNPAAYPSITIDSQQRRRTERLQERQESPPRKLRAIPGLIAALCVVSLLLLCATAFLVANYGDMQLQRERLRVKEADLRLQEQALSNREGLLAQYDERLAESAIYEEKSNFMDTYVVFVEDDASQYYHKYDCSKFPKNSFWAYSRNLAESNGYTACRTCFPE